MKFITRANILSSILFLILSFLLSAGSSFAETKTFIKEYTYHAGDEDSKNSSRTIALREVKRLLLEELGTYLESQTEVKNFQMTKDQITTLTAGIVGAEVIEDTWDGKVYWLKAKIAANPQDVIKSIDILRNDRAKVKELEELRKKSEELLKENERLNKELKVAKGEKKQEVAQAYKRNIDNLSAAEWGDRGHRLQQSGNPTGAIKAFNEAIELNPQDTEAYNSIGLIYSVLGNHQQAIKNYNNGIKMNPQSALLYSNRGSSYSDLGNYQQAINDFNKTIELVPQDAGITITEGLLIAICNKISRRLMITIRP
jgi:tetratricopeptide (TPR) repeat protein